MAHYSARPARLTSFADVATERNTVNSTRIDLRFAHPGLEARCPGRSVQCPVLADLYDVNAGMAADEQFVAIVAAAVAKADTGDGGPVTYNGATVNQRLVEGGVAAPPEPVTFHPSTADAPPPLTSGYVDDPVNAATGNMIHRDDDLAFPAIAAALDLTRTWNSRTSDVPGAFGRGWASVLDVTLDVEPGLVVAHLADGSKVAYEESGDSWVAAGVPQIRLARTEPPAAGDEPPDGVGDRRGWVLQTDLLRRFLFAADGRLTGWQVGVARVAVERDAGGRIVATHERVTGRSLRFHWGADGQVAALESDDGRRVDYERDAGGVVQRVVSESGWIDYVWDGELLVSVRDPDGVAPFVNVYDDERRVVEQTSPFGRVSTYAYDDNGVTTFSDAAGVVQGMRHDQLGNLTAIFDVDGSAMHLAYDDQRRIVRVTERDGATIRYRYDGDDLVERVDPDGLSQAWTWDDRHRIVATVDRTGAVKRFEYDTDHRAPTRIVGADGATVTQTLDERGLPLEIVDADGVVTRFRWDRDGQLLATVDAHGAETTLGYDAHGMLERLTPPAGSPTVMTNEAGRLVRTGRGDGVWEYRYTPAGRACGGVEPGGIAWSATFGEHGAVSSLTDGTGSTVRFAYDAIGNIITTTAPDGAEYRNVYDEVGLQVAAIDSVGATSTKRYDRRGRLVEATDPNGNVWRRQVDVLGRTISSIAPDGAETRWAYHANGEVASVIAPDGRAWRTEIDVAGRPVVRIEPGGGRSTIEYTPAGRVASRTSPAGRTERFEYDAAGRLAAVVGFDGVRREIERDARGWIAAVDTTDPAIEADRGRSRVTYRWDDEYRLVGVTVREADGAEQASAFRRDAGGRLLEAVDPSGVTTRFTWDGRGQMASAIDPAGGVTTYDYDVRGRLAGLTTPGGGRTALGYGPDGRQDSAVDPAGAITRLLRDANGVVVGARHGDGTGWDRTTDAMGRELERVGTDDTVAGRFGYDVSGRLASATDPGSGVTIEFLWDDDDHLAAIEGPDGTRRIERDADGWVIATIDPDGVRTDFRRDAAGRITGQVTGQTPGPGLDAAGSPGDELRWLPGARRAADRDRAGRLTIGRDGTVYRYDHMGRLAEVAPTEGAPTSYAYSDNGLLATESGPLGPRRFRYDAAGRVVAIEDRSGTTTIDYDVNGRRLRETRPDGTSTAYRWDTFDRVAGIDRYDALDHLLGGVDISYDPLGRPLLVDGQEVGFNPVTFLPERLGDRPLRTDDPAATGIDNPLGGVPAGDVWIVGARVLDPATYQFLSPDPLLPVPGSNGAASSYTYSWYDPINWADPTGMRPLSVDEFGAMMDKAEQSKIGAAWEAIKNDPWGTLAMVGVAAIGVGLCFTPFAAVGAGILIGVGSSAAAGIATGTFNPRMVAVSGAFGAIPGGSTLRGAIMLGAATGAGETVVSSVVAGNGFPSPETLLLGTLTGGAGGAGGYGLAQGISRVRPAAATVDDAIPSTSTAAVDHAPTLPARPELPDFDGTTRGVLVTNEGSVHVLESGGPTPYPNYPNARHVEGQAASIIREEGSTGGVVYHNHPSGTCNFCHNMSPTLLPEGSTMQVVPPPGAAAPNRFWHDQPTEYTGNANDPKPPG